MGTIKKNSVKNQGQSTTEYLLLIAVATFFAVSFAMYFSPGFKVYIEELENRVAEKIAGGQLLTHPEDKGRVAFSSPPGAAGTEGSQGGAENGGGGNESGSLSGNDRGRDLNSSLEGTEDNATSGQGGIRGQAGAKAKPQEIVISGSPSDATEITPEPLETETKKEEVAPDKKEEKEESSKSRGVIYREGQEEEILGAKKVNWLRIFIIIFIVVIISYILFEIYKAVKLTRK